MKILLQREPAIIIKSKRIKRYIGKRRPTKTLWNKGCFVVIDMLVPIVHGANVNKNGNYGI